MNYVKLCEQMAVKQAEQELKPLHKLWPQGGDRCFLVYGYGAVVEDAFCDITDSNYHEMGNIHRTHEEAERAVKRQKAGVRVLRAIKKWNEENKGNQNYGIFKPINNELFCIHVNSPSSSKEEYMHSCPTGAFLESIKADWLLWKGWDL